MKKNSFFAGVADNKEPLPIIPRCGACNLYRHCISPKMPVYGKGKKEILVIGEAPGEVEDAQGRPFIGPAGQLLNSVMRRYGIELTQDCWITNSIICRPKKNELPEKAIDYCRPNVISAITHYKPKVIVLLGGAAVKSVIGWLWKEDPGGIMRWSGFHIPDRRLNCWICPTFHPSFVLRSLKPHQKDPAEVIWHRQIASIAKIKERPYETVPDSNAKVRRVVDITQAQALLQGMYWSKVPLCFDYETTMLKPDSEKARIVSCAFSDGETAVAFPWHGGIVDTVRKILHDPRVVKITWNASFEERWTLKEFGRGIANCFDGMLAAHTLDSRRGTKSLKFQAYARLGETSYDDAIKPFLEADGGNLPNRIVDLPLDKLLLYNGKDALLEHQLGTMLAAQIGVVLGGRSGRHRRG